MAQIIPAPVRRLESGHIKIKSVLLQRPYPSPSFLARSAPTLRNTSHVSHLEVFLASSVLPSVVGFRPVIGSNPILLFAKCF